MQKLAALAALVALIPAINAQQSVWGQCGGINWNGPTTCVSGTTCTKLNDWYFQCIPGATTQPPTTQPPTTQPPTTQPPTTQPPTTQPPTTPPTTNPPTTTGNPGGGSGNPYTGASVYASPYYADEIDKAAALITDATLKAKALSVKNIPTFTWLDTIAKVPTLETYLKDAGAKNQLLQIVVYDLPNRDCHAKASNGELLIDKDGVNRYKREYIDAIVALIKKYPQTKVVAVVEPDSLANLVTNLSDSNCQKAQAAYLECTNYAVKALAAVGVTMYLDAGHAGWLGWPANLTPAAQLFAKVFKDAGSPPQLRGLATNVANYNALRASSPDPVTPPNQNYDEIHYIEQLAPALQSQGFPAHFIVDQGRSGVQNIRDEWGNWCNIEGAGFGTRPTTNTGSSLIDAIVWVKPGGESDGTSDTSASRYDSTCGLNDAKKPAPEAGAWFQNYFVDLVKNANPPL